MPAFPGRAPRNQLRGPQWVPDVAKEESQVDYEHRVRSQVVELAHRHNLPDLRTHIVDGDVGRVSTGIYMRILSDGGCRYEWHWGLSRSLFVRVLLGDTARILLDELQCDVLIIKPPE